MAGTSLIRKLRLLPGQRILILNAPDGYMEELGPLPEGVELADGPEATLDFVHLFARNVGELERMAPVAIGAVKHDGLLWISYPKRSAKIETDITRDKGWDVIASAGLRPVTQISVDEVWSALRFRPAELVGKR
jgi:hypothetical protein